MRLGHCSAYEQERGSRSGAPYEFTPLRFSRLWGMFGHTKKLQKHNLPYGFAKGLSGLGAFWGTNKAVTN